MVISVSVFECREIRQRLAVFDDQPPEWPAKGSAAALVMDTVQQRMEEALGQHTILDPARKMYRKSAGRVCHSADWIAARKVVTQRHPPLRLRVIICRLDGVLIIRLSHGTSIAITMVTLQRHQTNLAKHAGINRQGLQRVGDIVRYGGEGGDVSPSGRRLPESETTCPE